MPSGCDSTKLYVYRPEGPPLAAGQPQVNTITVNADASYHLTGLKLTGISEGASFGDDAQMASNFPLVRLLQSGTVQYARTHHWSTSGVMTGSTPVSTEFTLPGNVFHWTGNQSYSLQAVSNGNASVSVPFCAPTWVKFGQSAQPQTGEFDHPFSIVNSCHLCGGIAPVVAIDASTQPSQLGGAITLNTPMSIVSVGGPSSIGVGLPAPPVQCPQSCPSGQTWSATGNKCVSICPSGEAWNSAMGHCEAPPSCPVGSTTACPSGYYCSEPGGPPAADCRCLQCTRCSGNQRQCQSSGN